MQNLLDRGLFSRNMRLELNNLCVAVSTDIGKLKASCYRADQQESTLLFNKGHRYGKKKGKEFMVFRNIKKNIIF